LTEVREESTSGFHSPNDLLNAAAANLWDAMRSSRYWYACVNSARRRLMMNLWVAKLLWISSRTYFTNPSNISFDIGIHGTELLLSMSEVCNIPDVKHVI
jgi:hypothetical protein